MPAPAFFRSTRASQRGMAATLMILFVGMALSVTALSMMYGIGGAQQQQMAAHATSPAESRVWSGVEWVRLYLQGQLTQDSTLANVTVGNLPISATGLSAQIVSKVASGSSTLVTATITATNNLATNTLQVVYVLTPASSTPATPAGGSLPPALQFNGNFNYTGGSLSITNGTTLANIVVNGVLSISNGAKAYVSGCAKGGINLSGGGIADNATLNTEGTFSMSSSSAPVNLTVGAKSINITQSGGSYVAIQAGAFRANVLSGGSTVGTALVGGIRNSDNSITAASSGTALITLSSGAVYTLDLSKATQSAGAISTSNAQLISGTGTLPASISLTYNAVYGGDVNFLTGTVGTFWGNTLALTGYSATYNTLKANSDVSILTANVGKFQGGGNLSVTQWNTPTFSTASQIAGQILNQNGTPYTGNTIANLTANVAGASPGLPGVPYCNITATPVDVTPLKSQANYVFSFSGNTPMLTIQNVKTAAGTTVSAGPYNLATTDLRTLLGNNFMICNYGNSTCGNGATPGNGWNLTGITAFPPGVLWFDGNVTFNGVQSMSRLTNTVLTTGDVTLTSSGMVPLYSPNFSGYSNLCTGSFYPTNLCNKNASPPGLATWTDSANVTHSGLPIGNIAIEANGGLSTSGWTLYGNVILGGLVSTSGATTNIKGSLTTGNNSPSPTTISQGGIAIDVSSVTSDQTITNPSTPSTGSGGTSTQATTRVRWVRAY
ncbi:beta strand repeat-containing protein [Pseudomonas sp. RHF3.3-3]|uniref:beta strand repeat-containing protein n=1 Tax=Pseudomonas sp. RHF3.3-3 TaxID=3396624 RepID=UPI003A8BD40B